ncbi:MAG: fused MFS/spermidine synthase [Verrucomicrobia bacterium]|nr:fused MFS/spermidine synthase [Verrucomicrobiota bacterium]
MSLPLRLPFLLIALLTALPGQPASTEPRVLYDQKGEFGSVIVTEYAGLRTLQFQHGGARQSVVKLGDPEHLELPYASYAFSGLALCGEPRRILIVGLGGGTLPMFLRRHYPAAVIDAVEIDPDVVRVARRYFGFTEDERLQAHTGDGRAFIEKNRQPYDLIFLDAFGADSVPPSLTTREFLRAVRRSLKPTGVVVGNIWERRFNPLYDSMIRTYQDTFDEVCLLEVGGAGNRIVLALPRRQNLDRDSFAAQAGKVSTTKKFRFDLSTLVRTGFLPLSNPHPEGRILLDAELPR